MNNIQIIATRGGSDVLNTLSLFFDENSLKIPIEYLFIKQYNIRFILEIIDKKSSYPEEMLGNKIVDESIGEIQVTNKSVKTIQSNDSHFYESIKLNFYEQLYFVRVKIYEDIPINNSNILSVIPIPVDMINICIYFSKNKINLFGSSVNNKIEKYFDSYNHLGFFLADIPRMEQVILNKYGKKEINLVEEFANTTIIDELFDQEIIMIVWGINPFTYPIYSAENTEVLKSFLGREFPQEGIFNIREDINELSIVPGYELARWPQLLDIEWKKVSLKGKGKTTHIKPFCLKDKRNETIITSFLVYRSEDIIETAQPLINVDLLYS